MLSFPLAAPCFAMFAFVWRASSPWNRRATLSGGELDAGCGVRPQLCSLPDYAQSAGFRLAGQSGEARICWAVTRNLDKVDWDRPTVHVDPEGRAEFVQPVTGPEALVPAAVESVRHTGPSARRCAMVNRSGPRHSGGGRPVRPIADSERKLRRSHNHAAAQDGALSRTIDAHRLAD